MRRLLRDGALAGLAGGAALALVLLLAGEGSIGRAVDLERRARPGQAGTETFSRGTQQAGGALAAVVWGVALGLLVAVAWVLVRRHLRPAGEHPDWRAATTLAGMGFLTVNVVPFLKYPANPPGVGDPATIGRRTTLYLLMLAWSALSTAAAWRAARWTSRRGWPDHVRLPAVVGLYATLVVVGLAALPGTPDAVPDPATLVWHFRLTSLAGTGTYWAVCGTAFGWLRLAADGCSPFAALRPPSPTEVAADT
ncbi:MAG: CbtA family protein [Acidimicrobiales bacterium]